MSNETLEHLHINTLIGNTTPRPWRSGLIRPAMLTGGSEIGSIVTRPDGSTWPVIVVSDEVDEVVLMWTRHLAIGTARGASRPAGRVLIASANA